MRNVVSGLRPMIRLGLTLLLAALLGGCVGGPARPGFQSPPATPTKPSPTPAPTLTPLPTKGPVATPTPVALCTFGPPAPPEPGLPLEAYVFSEPSVVLTHTSGIGIVGWLPDGQNLLITRLSSNGSTESIGTFNVIERTEKGYGEWGGFSIGFNPKPVWLNAISAVAFADDMANQQIGLYIAQGDGSLPQVVVADLTYRFIAASPTGDRVAFFAQSAKGQPEIYNTSQEQVQTLPFQLPFTQRYGAGVYHAVWHPDGNRIGFYSNAGFYLADVNTGQICEIDLGTQYGGKRWAAGAQWSPNGHYLAALTTVGEPAVKFIDLTIIDMGSGEQRRLNLGHQYLYGIAWDPNSHTLLLIAEAGYDERGSLYDLYVVDAATGNSRQILADQPFVDAGTWGVAWSPTGQQIALGCPTTQSGRAVLAEGRVCIISVEVR